jgi:hypothetical protein
VCNSRTRHRAVRVVRKSPSNRRSGTSVDLRPRINCTLPVARSRKSCFLQSWPHLHIRNTQVRRRVTGGESISFSIPSSNERTESQQLFDFGRNGPGQLVVLDLEKGELAECTHSRANRTRQQIVIQIDLSQPCQAPQLCR